MIKVLVVDDFPIIREGLKQTLEDTSDIRVGGEAADSEEIFELLKSKPFDVVLLDISMPGRGGIEILKQIKARYPHLPVLMLSMYPEEQYAVRAMKAGSAGYVTKSKDLDELLAAIRRVAAGRKYVSESLAEKLAGMLDGHWDGQPLHKNLSDREFEVLLKLAEGRTVSEVADQMCLSVKTVSTYRSRILEKMGMKNNAELTRYAIKNSLVS